MIKYKSNKVHTMININLDVETQGIKTTVEVCFGTGIDCGVVYVDGFDVVDYTNISYNGKAYEGDDYKGWELYRKNLLELTGVDFDAVVNAELEKLLKEEVLREIARIVRPTKQIVGMELGEDMVKVSAVDSIK